MLVSIITPSYNSELFIEETYQSIVTQTHKNWEWLVTDDGSTDSTWEILLALQSKDPRIKPLRNKMNSGAAVSRNNSISRASGEFLAFLDSDDLWLPKKLELHLKFVIENESKVDISFTPYSLIDEKSNKLEQYIDMKLSGCFSYDDMLIKKATMGCCTVIVRKNAFTDLSMPLIRAGQDYALWLKLLRTGKSAYIYQEPLSQYRIVSNSLSRNKLKKAYKIWQVYRKIEKLNIIKALYVFSHYAVKALIKLNVK
jgi:teichuronic acid biosynthesis glycosyltransferase TuaG